MAKLDDIARLFALLHDMEKELGLSDLSDTDRRVLLSIQDLSNKQTQVETNQILDHRFLETVSRPTVFRSLKKLLDAGYAKKSGGRGKVELA